MIPSRAAVMDVAMNRVTLVRFTGTPTFLAATGSPPTLNVQLPNLVRASTHVATAVIASHQRTFTVKSWGDQNVWANTLLIDSKPEPWSMSATRTVPVICFVTPRLAPRSTKKVPRVTMNEG